jgi:RNA polymerase sigma factor (sigma-70 family)
VLDESTQHLLRELTPQVLGILVRRYRDFAGCEDAVQEALITAAAQWPREGIPDNARGWLLKVATRRLTDQVRADTARRLREQLVVSLVPADEQIARAADAVSDRDDTLDLYFMCCHPALSPSSQVALTLRAIGGLTTAEIARAFMVPEATMAQRVSRAKQTISSAGRSFAEPTRSEQAARLPAVLHVLYLIFNEGYAPTSGADVVRVDLSSEAIRVTRLLHQRVSTNPEVKGLLALMLLTDARRNARVDDRGLLVPLDEQDRSRWQLGEITEGTELLREALAAGAVGTYQIQAAIAALHDEASSADTTDWRQILALYTLLQEVADSPMVGVSRAIALAMVDGPFAGLRALDALAINPVLRDHYRLEAARGHLHERAGNRNEAVAHYRKAADKTANTAERHYLMLRAARLAEGSLDEFFTRQSLPSRAVVRRSQR